MTDDVLLIDKPAGWTSHDVVAYLRRKLGVKKVGHAGTLDPFATGLLIVGVGRDSTKRLADFLKMDKSYEATVRLGATSDTDDRTGKIEEGKSDGETSRDDVRRALDRFVGTIQQIPPAYSAKKIAGKKMYELARRGIVVEQKPVTVAIHSIDLLDYHWPLVRIRVNVSSGTYIRALARDLGEALGVGAYLEELRRTSIGPYDLTNARTPDKVGEQL